MTIKRISFRVDIPEGYPTDNYITSTINEFMGENGIDIKNIINITEKEADGFFHIAIYYKEIGE